MRGAEEHAAAVEASTARLAALLRVAARPEVTAIGSWSVHDVAVHLADLLSQYPRYLDGSAELFSDPMAITDHNERVVSADRDTPLPVLADRIEAGGRDLAGAVRRGAPDEEIGWHGGARLPARTIPALAVTEAFVHGHDVAAAERRRWGLERTHLCLALAGITALLPLFVDRRRAAGMRATFEVRIRGGARVGLAFGDGSLEVQAGAPRPDCVISADPGAFLLVGYRRLSPWRAVAHGKMVAWGRRPWLGLTLPALLRSP